MRLRKTPWLVVLLLGLGACATPAMRVDRQAENLGFQRRVVAGAGFEHVVYGRQRSAASPPRRLHVYLEGDGSPWIGSTRVAPDPTPRRPYALELMALDAADAIYVGRPCYHGYQTAVDCDPRLWTSRRYSPTVVESLRAAIETVAEKAAVDELVLIGYSGGGVLAMLLAEHLENTRAVVTVAANLDTDAWTAAHHYSPLAGSLNPAERPALAPSILQLHLAGGRDESVPAEIVESVSESQPGSRLLLYPDFDHSCCWTDIWPDVLDLLARCLSESASIDDRGFALSSTSR